MRLEESWGLLGMKSNWKEIRLGDVAEIKGGKRLPKGKQLSSIPNSHPYIKVKNMGQQKVLQLNSEYEYVDDETQKSISRYIVSTGDILISVVGTVGLVSIVGETLNNANQTENCDKITNLREIDADYLYYYLISPLGQEEIHKATVGAVQAKLPLKNIQDFSIICPDLIEQKKVASVLSIIDEKIACNERINDNLEQQLLSYYHELFVTNVKENWKEGTIADLGKVVGGSTPSKKKAEYYTDHGIAWITPKDLSNNRSKFITHGEIDITELGLSNSSAVRMPAGTVLFSSRAPIGYTAIADGEVTTNQGFKSVVPFENIGTAYVYCLLKENLSVIDNMASGSTFKEISGSTMKTVPAIIPDEDTLSIFRDYADAIFDQQRNNESENIVLTSIRDSLLPKLMSGELDVSNLDI